MRMTGRVATMRTMLSCALVAVLALSVAGHGAHADATWPPKCARADAPGGEWPQFGNQITGDRTQPREFFLNATRAALLAPVWTFDANKASFNTNSEITGYPIESAGCIYVGTNTGFQTPGWIFALNADTGEIVWRHALDRGVYNTLAVGDGLVYAFVSKVKLQADTSIGGPYVIAFDQFTGKVAWQTTVDYQIGSDAVSSPVFYDDMIWVGISATAAEVTEGDRGQFQGNTVLLDAKTGTILKKTFTIPSDLWDKGFAGAAQWATVAIDPETGYGFEGIGNPFNYDHEHERTNSVIKMDFAKSRDDAGRPVHSDVITNPLFGEIVGNYKGDVEEYFPNLSNTVPCHEVEDIGGVTGTGIECARLDLDFGAQPNLFKDANGRRLVGIGQKSGVYHVFEADTMKPVWKQVMGVPSPVGGIVGSAAYDGRNLYVPHTIGGYMASLKKTDGSINWVAPFADGIHWGPPVTMANGIIYNVDLKGFLDAYDAGTGAPILHRPMELQSDAVRGAEVNPTFSWGGTTIARDTVYATVGVGLTSLEQNASMPNGYVIAYRPFVNPPI